MILYVNGDSHSVGAEAAGPWCFAEDDSRYSKLGRIPHPENLKVSYGQLVANEIGATLACDAESASSNQRIIRTTYKHLTGRQALPVRRPDLVIIGWSTWEREEWLNNGTYYQVTASGSDYVPSELRTKYRQWVIEQDEAKREEKTLFWHDTIYKLHQSLESKNIPHIFFNTYSDFSCIRDNRLRPVTLNPGEYDWGLNYVHPYDQNYTYYNWCLAQGFKTVRKNSYHFGADAHRAWADFLVKKYLHLLLTQKS